MYTRNGIKAFLLFLIISPFGQVFAWWEAGHMIVADIAYANVKPNAKKKLKALLRLMASENTPRNDYSFNENNPNYTMMAVSHWPDDLHAFPNYFTATKTWHYIEHAYSTDGTSIPSVIPRDNVVFAINQMRQHVSQVHANAYSKARALSFLIHFVGDIHQPMHCAEFYSHKLPDGDRGGNSYKLYFKEESGDVIQNLHALWDSGLLVYPNKQYPYNVNAPKDIDTLMKLMTADYPKKYFGDKIDLLDPEEWQKESHQIAREAHEISFNGRPSQAYLDKFTLIAEQRMVLAGYRLAAILNQII